jgi:hypothetical protein
VRVLVDPLLGQRNANLTEQFDRLGQRLAAGHALVGLERLGDLQADPHHRVEAGHRLLEDHRDVIAPDLPQLVVGRRGQLSAVELDGVGRDLAWRHRDQADDRQRSHGLAGAALADDCHRLAAVDPEGYAADSRDDAVGGPERSAQVVDLKQRLSHD